MKPHLPLFVLCCLSMQLTAQIKNTYSFAQGDTTQVVITWDAWAETGDPISGCNIYRYDDQTNPINAELITSGDSAYYFIDTTGLDPYLPPKYIIKAVRDNNTIEVDYAHAFSSIEFFTSATGGLQMGIIPWHPDSCCMGVNGYVDGVQVSFHLYQSPYITYVPPSFWHFHYYYCFEWRFLYFNSSIYTDIKLTKEFIEYLNTTVGVPGLPEAGLSFSVYPNPVVENANISFNLPGPSNALLELYDAGGRKVKSLFQGMLPTGEHTFELNRSQLPPGLYFLRFNADAGSVARKIVVY